MSNTEINKAVKGFTLVELLVVIAIIALLMGILLPALSRARELGKRAVCLVQIKQLQLGWDMYCEDKNDKVPSGDVWYSWLPGFPPELGGPQLSWFEWPHQFPHSMPPSRATNHDTPPAYPTDCVEIGRCKQREWYHAIDEGLLFRYIKDYRIYRCPVGNKGEFVTYSTVHSIKTWLGSAGPGSISRTIKLKGQIKRTSERVVFIDQGKATKGGSYLPYDKYGGLTYGWTPPARHGMGTTFAFADGHAEYKKWTDPHTLKVIKLDLSFDQDIAVDIDNCDCDLRWYYKAVWGEVPYDCTKTPRPACE